jgi:hypothetical protein
MEKLYSVRCNQADVQATETGEGGIFDCIDKGLINHPVRQVPNRGCYCADLYILDKQQNHQEISELIKRKGLKHEFTFEEAFFLINKTAQMFPWGEEWRFLTFLYSTERHMSAISRKIGKGTNSYIDKRIIYCKYKKPFIIILLVQGSC